MSMLVNDWPARWARDDAARIAVTDVARKEARTWGELDRNAGALAGFLARELRLAPGDRVAVLAESRLETVEAFFAVARLRAALVPLNTKLAQAELVRLLADASPRALMVSSALRDTARALLGELARANPAAPAPLLIDLDDDGVGGRASLSYKAALASGEGAPAEAVVLEADPWLVLYTSGSTGRPKGALVTHGQVIWNALQTLLACDLGREDSTVTSTPLFYTGGWNVLSTPLWYRGGRVHLLPAFEAGPVLETLERERATTFFGVPTTLSALAEHARFHEAALGGLRVILCGGAACPDALVRVYGAKGLGLRPGYGLTEVGPNCFGLSAERARLKSGSIGRPNMHLETRVTDDDGKLVPEGGEGELRLKGPTLFGGYLGGNRALDEDGFFRTGDIVRRDADGDYWLVGRKNDLFKSGGEKVYPGEVEAAIAAHPSVAEVCVVPVPDPRWGEVGFAVVVPRSPLPESDLREWLLPRLAKFKVPKSFAFVDALPRTETGKVSRVRVKERYARKDSGTRVQPEASPL